MRGPSRIQFFNQVHGPRKHLASVDGCRQSRHLPSTGTTLTNAARECLIPSPPLLSLTAGGSPTPATSPSVKCRSKQTFFICLGPGRFKLSDAQVWCI